MFRGFGRSLGRPSRGNPREAADQNGKAGGGAKGPRIKPSPIEEDEDDDLYIMPEAVKKKRIPNKDLKKEVRRAHRRTSTC